MHSITEFLTQILSGSPQGLTQGTSDGLTLWQSLVAMLIAYLGGVLSSLTPCVYPMIPITVSVIGGIGGQTHGSNVKKRSWKEAFARGIFYVAGMTMIYSLLGVLAGVSGKVFGSFTNHSSWYLGLGIMMSFASLLMLDVITFDPLLMWEQAKRKFHQLKSGHQPSHSAHNLNPHKEMSHLGAFLLGASSGFIAAPCTTPVLTSILAYIAKTQSIGLGFLLMLSFSAGLGTLLLLVAGFAGAVQILPRSGKWMKTVKMGSGLILLAFAEYLIYRAGSFGGP